MSPSIFPFRHANEKLGNKIREQSKAIMQLTAEKEYVSALIICVLTLRSYYLQTFFIVKSKWKVYITN